MSLLNASIFVTGAAIIALELLASRIMLPYFGISLYIWSGILSITLISIALGYFVGGHLAERLSRRSDPAASLRQTLSILPLIASIALIVAAFAYPVLFYKLAIVDLVLGAFVGCVVLLLLPVVAASAMNPVLVAYRLRRQQGQVSGDAGSGLVFFVSTVGSVVGVLVTAFGLIPYIDNHRSVLIVALCFVAVSLLITLTTGNLVQRKWPLTLAVITLAGGLAALLSVDRWTGRQASHLHDGALWSLEASEQSFFGTIKVLRVAETNSADRWGRILFHDGIIQNQIGSDGRSLSLFTYALESLAYAFVEKPRKALVLGLGAGIVPMRLSQRGIEVTVVEINPSMWSIAERYFGFDRRRVGTFQADARTFVNNCSDKYDVIVVDLFQGDGTPDYLATYDFFIALRACLAPRGAVVVNTFFGRLNRLADRHFAATLVAAFPAVINFAGFYVTMSDPPATTFEYAIEGVPDNIADEMRSVLGTPSVLTPAMIAGGRIIRDDRNFLSSETMSDDRAYREAIIRRVPPALLLN